MSLRDWFAGQALAGALANRDFTRNAPKIGEPDEVLACAAYRYADAMLEERIRKEGA